MKLRLVLFLSYLGAFILYVSPVFFTEMIKTPAIKATKKLKAAEKQLIAKIIREIIALRHPEGFDENDVADRNEEVRRLFDYPLHIITIILIWLISSKCIT